MVAARAVNFQDSQRKLWTHKALTVVNKGINAWGGEGRRLGQNGTCSAGRNRILLGNSQIAAVILGVAGNSDI
jgi:hypothetical protein